MSHLTNWDYGLDPPEEPLPWCRECSQERDYGEMVEWDEPDWRYLGAKRYTGICIYCAQPKEEVDE